MERFRGGYDFSAYGTSFYEDSDYAWFKVSETLKYKECLKYSIDLHGGIYYFKKGKMVDDIYKTCKDISSDYASFRFKDFKKPADEPIIALAMAVNGAKPITASADRFCFLRNTKRLKADFFSKSLSYHFKDDVNGNGKLIHFATLRTILPIYQVEKRKVDYVWEHGCGWTIPTMLLNMIVAYTKSLALCIMSLKKIIIKRKVI